MYALSIVLLSICQSGLDQESRQSVALRILIKGHGLETAPYYSIKLILRKIDDRARTPDNLLESLSSRGSYRRSGRVLPEAPHAVFGGSYASVPLRRRG